MKSLVSSKRLQGRPAMLFRVPGSSRWCSAPGRCPGHGRRDVARGWFGRGSCAWSHWVTWRPCRRDGRCQNGRGASSRRRWRRGRAHRSRSCTCSRPCPSDRWCPPGWRGHTSPDAAVWQSCCDQVGTWSSRQTMGCRTVSRRCWRQALVSGWRRRRWWAREAWCPWRLPVEQQGCAWASGAAAGFCRNATSVRGRSLHTGRSSTWAGCPRCVSQRRRSSCVTHCTARTLVCSCRHGWRGRSPSSCGTA